MPLIETKGAASAQGFGEFAASSGAVTYIEDVFSTYLYAGNSSTQTITNSIDLSTKGGLVWIKDRTTGSSLFHQLYDTARGATKSLASNNTNAEETFSNGLTSFGTTGFSLGSYIRCNATGYNYASWTFRKQPKFFDVVTYAGNGSGAGQTISHNLGSTPGCIIVKMYSGAAGPSWNVYHRSLSASYMLYLNSTSAASDRSGFGDYINNVTSTSFKVNSSSEELNGSGRSYVAYVFAHNAGGFGLSGTDNVISCGSFTTDGSGNATVTLGYEPQWVVIKNTTSPENWFLNDIMRGMPAPPSGSGTNVNLFPNTSAAESIQGYDTSPTATGFAARTGNPSQTYIYIAIRRGPMKVPTDATKVFAPVAYAGNNATNRTITSGIVTDMTIVKARGGTPPWPVNDRLRGQALLLTNATDAEVVNSSYPKFDLQNGWNNNGSNGSYYNSNGYNYINYNFQRAPNFFDEICYTGDGNSSQTLSHNLGATPQLILIKVRNSVYDWLCYSETTGTSNTLFLNLTNASTAYTIVTVPTSTTFRASNVANNVTETYVAYLFATCAGVSKVGSYTGTGALQTINCGFASGARFVLIKRTDSTGGWYTYDSARGITSGNDPYLLMNSTAAEVTGTNYVDTDSTGFKVTAAAPSDLNASGGTYIFLAIA